jgi:hypothetical protein
LAWRQDPIRAGAPEEHARVIPEPSDVSRIANDVGLLGKNSRAFSESMLSL